MSYSYVKEAVYIEPHKIRVVFEDGKQGILDLAKYLDRGGVFDILRDEQRASNFHLEEGILTWGDLDLAPESVYHDATGEPLPSWVEEAPVKKAM